MTLFSSQARTSRHASWTTSSQPTFWSMKTCLSVSLKFECSYMSKQSADNYLLTLKRYKISNCWHCSGNVVLPSCRSNVHRQYFASRCPKERPSLTFTPYYKPLTLSSVTVVAPFFAALARVEFDSSWIHYVAFNPYLCFLLLAGCCDWQGNLEMSGSSSSPRVSVTWN